MANNNILVTGASKGIGYEISRYLSEKKYHILATARSKEKLEKLQEENPEYITSFPCDLKVSSSIKSISRFIDNRGIRLTGLIHNAGLLIAKPFTDLTDEDWKEMWDANFLSAVRLLRELLPFFEKNAHFVTIGSMGGFQGSSKFPGLSGYSTTKGALSIWTECMAAELKKEGLSINCLCLGAVQTEMLEAAFPGLKAPVQPKQMAEYIGDFALKGHHFYNGRVLPVALGNP